MQNMGKIFGVHSRLHIAAGMLLYSYLIIVQTSPLRNENTTSYNGNTITDAEEETEKISPFWSYNDTVDLTKYEQFDHQRFIETVLDPELVQPTTSTVPKIKTPPHTRRRNFTKTQQPISPPIFEGPAISNVTARLGESTFLYCTVQNLKQRPVSWVRRRDWHILSSGVFMYTNDDRFHVMHADNADNWDLQIKYVQKRDAGSYECQVAMGTGITSHYYNLDVIVPTARILGREEYHIGKGSTINLICVIENGSSSTRNVVWVHNGIPLYNIKNNKKDDPSPIMVTTEVVQPDNTIQSRLFIRGASPSALGNYTCTAPYTEPDTVNVYVSEEGDNIAAIQRHGTSSSASCVLEMHIVLPMIIVLQRILKLI